MRKKRSTRPRARTHSPQDWPAVHNMDDRETQAASRVLRARSPFRYYGPALRHEVKQFESELACFIRRKHCVGVASGTAALEIALAALGVGPGDEVIVPGYFWVSTVAAIVKNFAIPVLVDVDDSFSVDPSDLLSKISARTKAVIFVHMGGAIGAIERVAEICKEKRISLLEDCAQSIGASKFGRMCGSFGDIAIFSFQMNKACTAGEGGALVTDDPSLFARAVAIHDLGYPRDDAGRLIEDNEDIQAWGFGCRMSEVTAAILRVQLKKLPALISELREVKRDLKSIVSRYKKIKPRKIDDPEGDGASFLKLRFESHEVARTFQHKLSASASAIPRLGLYSILMSAWGLHIYYRNNSLTKKKSICGHHSPWDLVENSFARDRSYGRGTLANLDSIVEQTLIIPIPIRLTSIERRKLLSAFNAACLAV